MKLQLTLPKTEIFKAALGGLNIELRVNRMRLRIGRGSLSVLKALKFFPLQANGDGLVLSVGQFCEFADETAILLGGNHNLSTGLPITFGSVPEILMTNRDVPEIKPFSKGPITIGSGVVASHRVSILSGVEIGDNVVMAAGCLVSRTLAADRLYAGTPAAELRALPKKTVLCQGKSLPWWRLSTDYLIRNMKSLVQASPLKVLPTDLDHYADHWLILTGTLDGVKLGQVKLTGVMIGDKELALADLPTAFCDYVNQMTGNGPVLVDTSIWTMIKG